MKAAHDVWIGDSGTEEMTGSSARGGRNEDVAWLTELEMMSAKGQPREQTV